MHSLKNVKVSRIRGQGIKKLLVFDLSVAVPSRCDYLSRVAIAPGRRSYMGK